MPSQRAVAYWYFALGIIVVGLLVSWEMGANQRTEFFFSKPSLIISAFFESIISGQAQIDGYATFGATVGGVVLGLIVGAAFGLLGATVSSARTVSFFVVSSLAAFPILAIAPMFMLWFGTGPNLKLALATLLASVTLSSASLLALDFADSELSKQLRANGWSQSNIALKVIIPAGVRQVLGRLPDAANAAFLGAFVGEFIAADRGIGYRILRSGSLYQVDVVLAYSVLAVFTLIGLQIIVWLVKSQTVLVVQRITIPSVLKGQI